MLSSKVNCFFSKRKYLQTEVNILGGVSIDIGTIKFKW